MDHVAVWGGRPTGEMTREELLRALDEAVWVGKIANRQANRNLEVILAEHEVVETLWQRSRI